MERDVPAFGKEVVIGRIKPLHFQEEVGQSRFSGDAAHRGKVVYSLEPFHAGELLRVDSDVVPIKVDHLAWGLLRDFFPTFADISLLFDFFNNRLFGFILIMIDHFPSKLQSTLFDYFVSRVRQIGLYLARNHVHVNVVGGVVHFGQGFLLF